MHYINVDAYNMLCQRSNFNNFKTEYFTGRCYIIKYIAAAAYNILSALTFEKGGKARGL